MIKRRRIPKPKNLIPKGGYKTVEEYIKEFDRINNLKH